MCVSMLLLGGVVSAWANTISPPNHEVDEEHAMDRGQPGLKSMIEQLGLFQRSGRRKGC